MSKGARLEEFSITGDDRKWAWADARIDGDTVVVSSPAVPYPTQVRYAWQSNPAATFFNGAGLPAALSARTLGPAKRKDIDRIDLRVDITARTAEAINGIVDIVSGADISSEPQK